MSATQPVLSGGRWVDAGELVIGDALTAQDGIATLIFSARKVEAKVTVYNLDVSEGTFIGNGIVAHNKDEVIYILHPNDPGGP